MARVEPGRSFREIGNFPRFDRSVRARPLDALRRDAGKTENRPRRRRNTVSFCRETGDGNKSGSKSTEAHVKSISIVLRVDLTASNLKMRRMLLRTPDVEQIDEPDAEAFCQGLKRLKGWIGTGVLDQADRHLFDPDLCGQIVLRPPSFASKSTDSAGQRLRNWRITSRKALSESRTNHSRKVVRTIERDLYDISYIFASGRVSMRMRCCVHRELAIALSRIPGVGLVGFDADVTIAATVSEPPQIV